ncbi:MAG: hypothetical protein M5U28_42390 [Sandaracinaceae bacterium]|nr:hypothetical protein [Sandaracinaceae bacterium]
MNRRHFVSASLGALAAAAVSPTRLLAQERCGPLTEPNVEGPFYRRDAPFRAAIGSGLSISGVVRDSRCRPMRDAVMEIWQASPEGEYDLSGDGFRARLRTNAQGAYELLTSFPGHYRNGGTYRPAHIHVKVHANGRPPLTTQLYFPRDPHNDRDPWFRSSLVVGLGPPPCCHPSTRHARFDFVV